MMRAGDAVAAVYPALNRDLLLAGVLFHDSGKLWENCFPKESFIMPHDIRGELIGHVSIGIELVNRLWQRLKESAEFSSWNVLSPDSELVRLHLIHLVASHHGEKQFGSPVEPKTPEAMTLHLIDNLDAKLEMMASAYQLGKRLGPEVIERVRPLPTNLVAALPVFSEETEQGVNRRFGEATPQCAIGDDRWCVCRWKKRTAKLVNLAAPGILPDARIISRRRFSSLLLCGESLYFIGQPLSFIKHSVVIEPSSGSTSLSTSRLS